MKLRVGGQTYEITNWNNFSEKLLTAIGFMVEAEMVSKVNDLRLVDTGFYKRGFKEKVKGSTLEITNDAPYAGKLEYGTLAYFDQYGMDSFPKVPHPKKKDLMPKDRLKYPRGMQPFATMRRVLWNQKKMDKIISKAVRIASR